MPNRRQLDSAHTTDVNRPGRSRLVATLTVVLVVSGAASAVAQDKRAPLTLGGLTFSGSLRTRVETSDWFGPDAAGQYTYPAALLRTTLGQSQPAWDWQVELALPLLVGLPGDGVLPPPRGALGLGATYVAANGGDRHLATLFPKQAFVRFNRLGGRAGQSLVVGRYEFGEGTELASGNPTLGAVKRDRVAHRLLGHFAFTHVGRSLDGAWYALGAGGVNVTALAGRATRGVFDVNGWGELDVTVAYGALTGAHGSRARPGGGDGRRAGEWRVFYLGYHDGRASVVKVDSRAPATRQIDRAAIGLNTIGGHYVHAVQTDAGIVDTLAWGAAQFGSWGSLSHRAGALALEGGWQPPVLKRVRPWIRGGYNYGSGDADPGDGRHGTFFQAIPTPRIYARFPFFNMMNVDDRFVEVMLRLSSAVTVRTDVHALTLASAADLWYLGGGAFESTSFGYVGRPSGGQRDLATLCDVSLDATLTPRASLGFYFGAASGGPVPRATYGDSNRASFGYAELVVRF
jgi:hypothetical protein